MTWRVWAATFLFLAVVAGGVAVVHWYAYSTYYLGDHDGNGRGLSGPTVAASSGTTLIVDTAETFARSP